VGGLVAAVSAGGDPGCRGPGIAVPVSRFPRRRLPAGRAGQGRAGPPAFRGANKYSFFGFFSPKLRLIDVKTVTVLFWGVSLGSGAAWALDAGPRG